MTSPLNMGLSRTTSKLTHLVGDFQDLIFTLGVDIGATNVLFSWSEKDLILAKAMDFPPSHHGSEIAKLVHA